MMKAYYNMGLKHMAQATGYHSAVLQICSQFKKIHQFIIESWEALYTLMIKK